MNSDRVHVLNASNSILNTYLKEIRNIETQKDRLRFRKNIERIGNILAYEISKTLDYTKETIQTPLSPTQVESIQDEMVIMSILRAGIPLQQGILNYFDHADAGFIGAYRKHAQDQSFSIAMDYFTSPAFSERTIILCDPMLATGKSFISVLNAFKEINQPKRLILATVIASRFGIETLLAAHPKLEIWTAAEDPELTEKGYIVPGLGDAGDLAYGSKEQS